MDMLTDRPYMNQLFTVDVKHQPKQTNKTSIDLSISFIGYIKSFIGYVNISETF